jgi:hypothetical protein
MAKTSVVPAAATGSAVVHVRVQVEDLLRKIDSVCWAICEIQQRLRDAEGAAAGVAIAAAAAGLGFMAGLGLWQVPPDAKGCIKDVTDAEPADGSSCRSSEGESESGSLLDDAVVAAAKQAKLLELHAQAIESEGIRSMITVLRYMGTPEAASTSGSSSIFGLRHDKVVQMVQERCSYSYSSSSEVADVADSVVEGDSIGHDAELACLWKLLLALKPSLAAALHCSSLPAPCRSYEAFERAVLGWPPTTAAEEQQQQQRSSGGSGGSSSSSSDGAILCSCGKPGHCYEVMTFEAKQALLTQDSLDSDADSALDDVAGACVNRAVCEAPACVARELQQLAQQGPAETLLMKEGVMQLMHVLQRDLLRLPEECRWDSGLLGLICLNRLESFSGVAGLLGILAAEAACVVARLTAYTAWLASAAARGVQASLLLDSRCFCSY